MKSNKVIQFIIAIAGLLLITFGASQYQAVENNDGSLHLWILDIGQGDSILIDTPEHQQILVDGGRGSAVLSELSKTLPLTDKEIDLVISTHDDADHMGGLNEVLKHYKVDKIWLTGAVGTTKTYLTFLSLIAEKHIPTEKIMAGSKISFGSLQGIVISPLQNYDGITPESQNATSVVMFWQYGSETFLLTGDAETPQEQEMIARGVLRHANILKVSHHGSHTASSEEFLKIVNPEITAISVGKGNSYGHPHQEILDRLKNLNIPVLRTDQDGAVRFDITLNSYSYKTGL
ncbi:MAG: MBL fold metallo-hydrolase [Candidatus Berkelbacteria bacterium]|nr:MBL fold metallo-hydrolase [Candidatus Berkelbacteria bacterium]MCR4307835.1 MBL fold metallo-hydrolase [Candidatus Berkelbacteria bacterium]